MPPSSPYGSGCLSPEGDDLQPAVSVPSFVLCVVLAVSYIRLFRVVAIPQSGMLAQVTLWLHSQHSGLILKKHCSPRLLAQPSLASGGCRCLRCFSAGGVTVGLVICWFQLFIFFPCLVALCASKARHRLCSESVSWFLETSLFLRLPSWDGAPLPLLSLFLSFIFFPTSFRRQ